MKSRPKWIIGLGMGFGILSILFTLLSYSIHKDATRLYPIVLPVGIVILSCILLRKERSQGL